MSARYKSDKEGTRQWINSRMISDAMMTVGRDMAAQANAQGRSTYEAVPRTVNAGYFNTARSGAEVREVRRDQADVRNRTLVNLSRQYVMRGGG